MSRKTIKSRELYIVFCIFCEFVLEENNCHGMHAHLFRYISAAHRLTARLYTYIPTYSTLYPAAVSLSTAGAVSKAGSNSPKTVGPLPQSSEPRAPQFARSRRTSAQPRLTSSKSLCSAAQMRSSNRRHRVRGGCQARNTLRRSIAFHRSRRLSSAYAAEADGTGSLFRLCLCSA